jgi:hypothetical protein
MRFQRVATTNNLLVWQLIKMLHRAGTIFAVADDLSAGPQFFDDPSKIQQTILNQPENKNKSAFSIGLWDKKGQKTKRNKKFDGKLLSTRNVVFLNAVDFIIFCNIKLPGRQLLGYLYTNIHSCKNVSLQNSPRSTNL